MPEPLPGEQLVLPTDESVAEFIRTWKAEEPQREAAIRLQAENLRGRMVGRCGFHGSATGIISSVTTGPRG